jgi:hypothetical protein
MAVSRDDAATVGSATPVASFASIASRLSGAPRRYLQSRDGVEEPAGGRGRRYWVVSRGLCQFFKVPILPDAVAARKVDALTLEIERLSSFSDSGSHYDLGTGFAGIWIWDQAAVRVAAESIGIDVSRLQILPETALRPSADDGVRLVAALVRAGAMAGSRRAAGGRRSPMTEPG